MTPPSARERILDAAEAQVMAHGSASTTVDAVIGAATASKGAFFHHFPTKAHLGQALVERYAARDAETLESTMAAAEAESEDPAEQLLAFTRALEAGADEAMRAHPQCLFVSFIYERELSGVDIDEVVEAAILHWRGRIVGKLEAAATSRAWMAGLDLTALADHWFTTFEGSFLLARAVGDPGCLGRQLGHLRRYLELLFSTPAAAEPR